MSYTSTYKLFKDSSEAIVTAGVINSTTLRSYILQTADTVFDTSLRHATVTGTKTLNPGNLTATLYGSNDGVAWTQEDTDALAATGSVLLTITKQWNQMKLTLSAAAGTDAANFWTVTADFSEKVQDTATYTSASCAVGGMERATVQITATETGAAGDLTCVIYGSLDDSNWSTLHTKTIAATGTFSYHTDRVWKYIKATLDAAAGTTAAAYWTVEVNLEAYHAQRVGLSVAQLPDYADMLMNPLDMPVSGSKKYAPIEGVTAMPAELTLFSQSGEGIVTSIQLIILDAIGTVVWPMMLNIYYDGEVTPSFSAQLDELYGVVGITALDTIDTYSSKYLSLMRVAADNTEIGVNFRFPIPYTNGCIITLTDPNGVAPMNGIYANIMYKDSLPPCWNRNYRLKSYRTDGTQNVAAASAGTVEVVGTAITGTGTNFDPALTVGDCVIVSTAKGNPLVLTRTNDTTATISHSFRTDAGVDTDIAAGDTMAICKAIKFLDVAAGTSGYLISVHVGFSPTVADMTYNEGNFLVFLNAERIPSLEWSGTEDFFNAANYYASGQFVEDIGGPVFIDLVNSKVSAFRVFSDSPVYFTDGIEGYWPNVSTASGNVTSNWLCLYYEEQ